ncbi:hypothetical protein, partial [Bacillus cereus]|uniref:hypothetical protein n=1 Tax=Bacillus cereus TaxID=1396 RepID=UPI001C553115
MLFLGALYIYEGELPSQNNICTLELSGVCTKREQLNFLMRRVMKNRYLNKRTPVCLEATEKV